jgi:hypothetical protein
VTLSYTQIPEHDRPPADARPSTALRALPLRTGRRNVLRAAVLGGLTLGAAALDWAGTFGTRPARAETGPNALQGWDRNDCHDAYPTGYPEVGDTSGAYVNTYAACFGGSWRGSDYCEAGWHKYGTWDENGMQVDHTPISTACGSAITRNAWRWTTPAGVTYRCSDGFSTFWGAGNSGQTYLTICRAAV